MIWIAFSSMLVVFAALMVVLYFALGNYNTRQADGMTKIISTNDGIVPKLQEYVQENFQDMVPYPFRFDAESAFRTRYFIVYFDKAVRPSKVNVEHVAAIDRQTAFEMAKTAIASGNDVGYIDEYRFRISVGDGASQVIFLDCSESSSLIKVVLILTALISLIFTILVTLIFAFCSGRVAKPFEENAQMQKQFITDASHELKTPLSIISANAEVLEYKNGSNDWTRNIIDQTKRMDKLISDLLTLSKTAEVGGAAIAENVNLSGVVREMAESFCEVAGQKNAELKIYVPDGVALVGNSEQLQRLVSILMENAAKYVSEDGEISVSLENSGKNAVLKIYNTAELGNDFNCKRLFDRFYRPDSSRSSETGGYGIGLSIAKKITEQLGGTLSARQVKGGICFTASIPCNVRSDKTSMK